MKRHRKAKVAKVRQFKGARQAEVLLRRIRRLQEGKFPVEGHEGEWYVFARTVQAGMEVMAAEMLRVVNPSAFAKSKMELVKSARAQDDEDSEEDEG